MSAAVAGTTSASTSFRPTASYTNPRDVTHRVMALLVGIDSDCDHRSLLIVWDGPGDVEAAGQSCVE